MNLETLVPVIEKIEQLATPVAKHLIEQYTAWHYTAALTWCIIAASFIILGVMALALGVFNLNEPVIFVSVLIIILFSTILAQYIPVLCNPSAISIQQLLRDLKSS